MPTAPDVFAKIRGHERVALLRAARDHGLLPYFHEVESPAMPVVQMDGAPRIMLGSNNYLGLTADERVIAGARDALAKYGTGLTGSRLLNGTTPRARSVRATSWSSSSVVGGARSCSARMVLL